MDVLDDTIDKLNKATIRQIVYKIQDDKYKEYVDQIEEEQQGIEAH